MIEKSKAILYHADISKGYFLVFDQLNETTLIATLKFLCQSLSSLKYRFCGFHKAYLVLGC